MKMQCYILGQKAYWNIETTAFYLLLVFNYILISGFN
uniref:Uncharacterized protein n=1 Tax=Anguilla anguilla TaxID=7936 RepID=A0A0E9RJH3_ANGAN